MARHRFHASGDDGVSIRQCLADLPWVEDGTRMFGSTERRQKFFDLSKQVLERRGVRWAT